VSDNNEKIGLELTGDPNKAQQALRSLESTAQKTFGNIGRYVDAATKHFGPLATAITALSTGLVLKKLFSLHDWMPIDQAMLRMQANWGKSRKEMGGFFDELSDFSSKSGLKLDETFGMAHKLSFFNKPGDVVKILSAVKKASDATGAAPEEMLDSVTRIMKMYQLGADKAKEISDSIVASRLNPEFLEIALQRATKIGGSQKDFKEVLAFFSALNKMGYSSIRTIQPMMAMIDELFTKTEQLKSIGINPFKMVDGKRVRKSTYELLGEIGPKFDALEKKMAPGKFQERVDKALGPGAYNFIKTMIAQREKFQQAMADQDNASELSGRRSKAFEESWSSIFERIKAQIGGVKRSLESLYDFAKPVGRLFADNPTLTKGAAWTAAGVSAAILGTLAYKKGKALFGDIANTAGGIVQGKAIQEATGVTPVFVTNWPGGILPGGAGMPPVVAGGGGWMSKIGLGLKLLSAPTAYLALTEALAAERPHYAANKEMYGQMGSNELQDSLAELRDKEVKNKIEISIQDNRTVASVDNRNTDLSITSVPRGNSDPRVN
jgi:hypothetical protein